MHEIELMGSRLRRRKKKQQHHFIFFRFHVIQAALIRRRFECVLQLTEATVDLL